MGGFLSKVGGGAKSGQAGLFCAAESDPVLGSYVEIFPAQNLSLADSLLTKIFGILLALWTWFWCPFRSVLGALNLLLVSSVNAAESQFGGRVREGTFCFVADT